MADQKNDKKRGRNDAKETLRAYIMPEVTNFIVNHLVPDKFFQKNAKEKIAFLKIMLPAGGYLARRFTNLPPFIDDTITDFAQELTQSFDIRKGKEEAKKEGSEKASGKESGAYKDLETLQVEIVTKLIFASADHNELVKALMSYEEFIKSTSEVDCTLFLTALSKLPSKQVLKYFLLGAEDQKKAYSVIYSKADKVDESPKPENNEYSETKSETHEPINNIFADDGKIAKRLDAWKEKINQLKNQTVKGEKNNE